MYSIVFSIKFKDIYFFSGWFSCSGYFLLPLSTATHLGLCPLFNTYRLPIFHLSGWPLAPWREGSGTKMNLSAVLASPLARPPPVPRSGGTYFSLSSTLYFLCYVFPFLLSLLQCHYLGILYSFCSVEISHFIFNALLCLFI